MTRLRPAAFWISVVAGIVVLGGCEPSSPEQAVMASAAKNLDRLVAQCPGCEFVKVRSVRPFDGAKVVHDDDRNVTCWVLSGYQERGISCLPDWMLTKHQGIPVQGGAQ